MKRLLLMASLAALAASQPAYAGNPTPSGIEREFVGLVNAERAAHGLAPVEISPNLTDVADDYAAFYGASGIPIDHIYDPPYTARAHGGGCSGWDGPVLASGDHTARSVLDGWLGSEGHRVVLLDPTITHMGPGFNGDYQLAFGLTCEPNALNTSGDFGAVPEDVVVDKLKARGNWIRARVEITAGKASVRLFAKRGRRVVHGKRERVKAGRGERVRVKVPRDGRWKVWLRADRDKHKLGRVRVR